MQRFPGGFSLLATAIISTVLASEALGSDPGRLLSRSGSSGSAPPDVLLGRLPLQVTAPHWSAFSLFGGEMTSIVGDPTDQAVAWVGSRDAGVFRTTDNGRTWRPSRQGLTFSPIRKLLALPTRPVTLYAGTDFDGVWKSVDGGASWARAGTTLPGSMVVFNLAVDPLQPDTIFAGLAGGVAFSIGGVFRSRDAGATWQQADTGIPRSSDRSSYPSGVFALALNPSRPTQLAAGTVLQGAFGSTDGGESWAAINQGVPFRTGSDDWRVEVEAMAFDPHHPDQLRGLFGGQLYRFDSGSWFRHSTSNLQLGFLSSRLFFHPGRPDLLFAAGGGLYTSGDGGSVWTSRLASTVDVALWPGASTAVLAARDNAYRKPGGVSRSTDLGESWTEASDGLTALEIRSVATDPSDPRSIYAGTGTGFLFVTHDGGQSWTRLPSHASQADFNFSEIDSIAVDPRDSGTITVAAFVGLYRSTDRGATFQKVTGVSSPYGIATDRGGPASIYYVATNSNGVFRSLDGGVTWEAKTQGLPLFGGHLNPVLSIAVDPGDADTVWAGTQYGGGILRTTDGGERWTSLGLTQENFVEAISVAPGNGEDVLVGAGTTRGNIYRSVDGGRSWQRKLTEIGFVRSLVRDPRDSRVVYAGTEGSGVLRSTDGGETWADFTGAIFYPLIYGLAIAGGEPPVLIAGSYGSGLYGTRLSEGGEPCIADDESLCLLGNRFQVTARYVDYSGGSGTGKAVSLTPDTGYFWFFTPSNVEAVIKMVPFCENGRDVVAVYATGLTDLGVTFTVTDTATGQSKNYANPLGTPFRLIRDGPFTCVPSGAAIAAEEAGFDPTKGHVMPSPVPVEPLAVCTPDEATLCLVNGRFRVTARYRDYSSQTGTGKAISLTSDTGYFWFFSASNVEVVLKLVSFCGTESNVNAVYANGLTDLGIEIEVTDTVSGFTARYTNALGSDFELIRDGPFSCP